MSSDSDSPSGRKNRIVTRTYRGPDRRAPKDNERTDTTSIHSVIRFDPRGNAVWNFTPERPRRREDDPTINGIKSLDINDLSLKDDAEPAEDPPADGYDPYARGRE